MKHILSREVSILLNSAKASYANTLGLIENVNQSIKSRGLDIEVEINSKGNICAFNHKAKNCPEMLMTEDELIEYIEKQEKQAMENSENKITIIRNTQGDTRSVQGNVSFAEFEQSNRAHIKDVRNIMIELANAISSAGEFHDFTKIKNAKQFYKDFTDARKNGTDFTKSDWYQMHIHEERHHINSYVHDNVNLINVLEMIADCTAAGLARSGKVRPITIDKDVLYKAFENTCKMVLSMCELKNFIDSLSNEEK